MSAEPVAPEELEITIPVEVARLAGNVRVPDNPSAIVVFAHGSGSSRHSPRNRRVGETLNQAGMATLLLDLLTEDEEARDRGTAEVRFDIELLARRVVGTIDWLGSGLLTGIPIGLFGASTGAAAALVAAAARPDDVAAVVSRGGRPDLAGPALPQVRAPTLLVVGGADEQVLQLNRQAHAMLECETALYVVPDAGHLFEEEGALEEVAMIAADWFSRHIATETVADSTSG